MLNIGARDGKDHDPTYDLFSLHDMDGIEFEGGDHVKVRKKKVLKSSAPHHPRANIFAPRFNVFAGRSLPQCGDF